MEWRKRQAAKSKKKQESKKEKLAHFVCLSSKACQQTSSNFKGEKRKKERRERN